MPVNDKLSLFTTVTQFAIFFVVHFFKIYTLIESLNNGIDTVKFRLRRTREIERFGSQNDVFYSTENNREIIYIVGYDLEIPVSHTFHSLLVHFSLPRFTFFSIFFTPLNCICYLYGALKLSFV